MRAKVKIQSSSPFFDEKSIQRILEDVEAVLRSGHLTDGPYVKEFEKSLRSMLGLSMRLR